MPRSAVTDDYEIVDHEQTAVSDEQLGKIRSWLQPTDYLAESGEFRRHLSSQAPGTGLWLTKTAEYEQWHRSHDTGSLWIKGVPGAGKSVIAASLIQHLKTTESVPVLFFFFRNIVAANFSPRSLVQDWLAQLLSHSPKLQFALEPYLTTKLDEVSDNDLIDLLLKGLSSLPRVYCIADALDEMTLDNRPFLDRFNSLATFRPQSVKVLMTSRPKQYLQSALRDSSIVQIALEQRLVDPEIASYLRHRMHDAQISNAQSGLEQQIVDMMAERSRGLFLYAKLIMDHVEPCLRSDSAISVVTLAQSLPVGLEEMYALTLAKQRHEQNISISLQIVVLQAVIHASRPLRLNELAHLIQCIQPDAAPAGHFKKLVAASCGALIEILEDETLQVIHHSFTEYLRGDSRHAVEDVNQNTFPTIDSNATHRDMSLWCLRYLQSGSLLLHGEDRQLTLSEHIDVEHNDADQDTDSDIEGESKSVATFDYQQAKLRHAFLSYAVENWAYHASHYDADDQSFFSAIEIFANPDDVAFNRWLTLQWHKCALGIYHQNGSRKAPTALHLAAFCGLSKWSSRLCSLSDYQVDKRDGHLRTPLHWASERGHTIVCSLLISRGADPNAEDIRGLKPLHLAASRNHASVVTVILQTGVDPATVKTKEDHSGRLMGGEKITTGECALLYVSERGHYDAAMALVPFCPPETLEQLLCECCRFSRTDIVLAILRNSDVSADAAYRGATALHWSCSNANPKCVDALIKRGADVHKSARYLPRKFMNGGTVREQEEISPLHALISRWRDERNDDCKTVLQILLQAGADLDGANLRGKTPLLAAAGQANRQRSLLPSAIKALLDAGADPNKVDPEGNTALLRSFESALDPEVVRLLIEHGSDPNHQGSRGCTALYRALSPGTTFVGKENIEVTVKYLLEHGADPTIKNSDGRAPIEQALSAGVSVFQLLLPYCKDDATKQRCWFMTGTAPKNDTTRCIDLLLAEGINIDSRNRDGRTLLLCHMERTDIVNALRDRGASMVAKDSLGRSAIHILCSGNHSVGKPQSIQTFIDQGNDPQATDDHGNTLLHLFAPWYRGKDMSDFVRWLVGLGISVNAVNHRGLTALHIFVESHVYKDYENASNVFPEFIQVLAECGEKLDLNVQDEDGFTPLHLAALHSEYHTANLVQVGADVSIKDKQKRSALQLACRAHQSNVVGFLTNAVDAALLNSQDDSGRTPLHDACLSGDLESVAYLINAGADVHAKTGDGQTALHDCAAAEFENQVWFVNGSNTMRSRDALTKHPLVHNASSRARDPRAWCFVAREQKSKDDGTSSIARMLIKAGVDIVASLKQYKWTAIEIAIDTGCHDFLRVFTDDADLLERTLKQMYPEDVSKRANLRTRIALSSSRFARSHVFEDENHLAQILETPAEYIQFLTPDDIDWIVQHSYDYETRLRPIYELLSKVLDNGDIETACRAKSIARLITDTETEAWLHRKIDDDIKFEKYPGSDPVYPALHLLCKAAKSKAQALRSLLQECPIDVNARSLVEIRQNSVIERRLGGTALHVLASADHWWQLEGLRILISRGGNVNAVNVQGQTPLHIAAVGRLSDHPTSCGSWSGFWRSNAVAILLDAGADPNIVDHGGNTPLQKAVNAPAIMRTLIQRGTDPTIGIDLGLFKAVREYKPQALELLLDHGASPDTIVGKPFNLSYRLKDDQKRYALVCASLCGGNCGRFEDPSKLVQILVSRGANLYLPLDEHETLLHWMFTIPPFANIATLLNEPCVSQIDFNARDQRGMTVLMAACAWTGGDPNWGNVPTSKTLPGPPLQILDTGRADASCRDHEERTALHHLLSNPKQPDDTLLQYICRAEVKPTLHQKDKAGYTPLHCALKILRPVVVELLLDKGAQLLEPDPCGKTALHHIAGQYIHGLENSFGKRIYPVDYFERCKTLWNQYIDLGGDINVRDDAGDTPLFAFLLSASISSSKSHMCHLDHLRTVFPIDKASKGPKLDLQTVNNCGETALHIVARRDNPSHGWSTEHDVVLFKTLMDLGLDPLKEDNQGRSALDVASACGKDGIVALMGRK